MVSLIYTKLKLTWNTKKNIIEVKILNDMFER